MSYFLCVFGMVMIAEGLPYFVAPERMKELIRRVLDMEDNSMRKFGFALMAVGLMVVYLGRR